MNGELDLAGIDRDGAIGETRDALSRAGFLTAAGLGGVGALMAIAEEARAASLPAGDIDVLNYALSLEYLQAAFYTEAERSKALKGRAALAATQVGAVERAHVDAFRRLLGRKAIGRPRFDFQGVTEGQRSFLKTAVAFEDLAVEAYKGQAPKLRSRPVLAAALGIHTVEARHAAWMRYLHGILPAASAFDDPRPRKEIDRIVRDTGFVTSRPVMTARSRPSYAG
jgi:rubrerythrin